jgi:hypothetical protein
VAIAFTPDVPGAPEISVEPDVVRGPRVVVAGTRVRPRRERGRPVYPIPMADGSERLLTLHGAFMGLRARFEEREYPVEPRLTMLELFMVVLPLALVTIQPPLGALAAAVGVMVNLVVMRRPWSLGVRVLVAGGVVLGAWLLIGLLTGRMLG